MKVLLISANTVTAPYSVYPLGLDYVAGAIRADHTVEILDMNSLSADSALEDRITAFGPDIVGIGLRNIDNTDAVNPMGFMDRYHSLMQRVRRTCSVPVVLGGCGFTVFPRECMARLQADYGIVGEGERLKQLLDALEQGIDPQSIEGVITRNGSAFTGKATPAPWSGPVLRHFDAGRVHPAYYLKHGGMLNLQSKRGCPFRCIYCTYPRIEGRRMRCAAPQEIAQTGVQLQQAGARYFFITDSAFNADIEHSLAVARALRKAGVTIPWGAFFAPTPLPADYFRVMSDCGLQHVEFGTESLSQPVLAAYRKPFRPQDVLRAHEAAVAAGLHVAHYFLFGGPGETDRTMAETFGAMEDLRACVFFIFCGMRIYPGTALHETAVRQGKSPAAACDLVEPVFYRPDSMDLPQMERRVQAAARGRIHWVVGGGGQETAGILARMYQRGYSGPLWEMLIPKLY